MKKKSHSKHLQDHFKDWFCQYGSHVVLHRAVPHILDGLKPSQRRVLHSLKELEDGRYNKAMNVIGNTAKYHPHGEASVVDTLVTIAQKGYLIDTQGNWGNTLTGDGAAAPRYIEGRLTPFAKEVAFSPKVTEWQKSYDGRNDEPVTLPMKFPILLAQGTEGIAVSLACKILPHNFLELCDASIAAAQNKPFTLLPDFPCGGLVDVTNYQDGKAGGKIKSRATIEIINKTKIEIKELAFGSTTTTLKESILEAVEKGKIKIKSIDDMTSSAVSLIIELHPGSDPEMITDALFAHTDCETVHHPIGVVVDGGKPVFLGVSDILKKTVERTKELLKKEMEVRLEEIAKRWMKLNLERIFIETKSYKVLEGCPTEEEGVDAITKSLTPHLKKQGLARNPSEEEIKALTSLPIRRISLYDMNAASREMLELEAEEKVLQSKIQHLTKTTIDYFKQLKKTYGTDKERKAEIHSGEFKTKRTTSEILPKHKTYWNKKDGFIGTGLKREEALAFETNEMTDVAAISSAGLLKFARIKEKTFFNEDLIWCDLAEVPTTEDPTKNRNKVISIVYSHPAEDPNAKTYAKRFQLGEGFVREKSYDICPPGSKILFLAAQPPGEIPPKIELKLKAKKRIKIKTTGVDFKEVLIKNRLAKGIVASPHACEAPKEH